MIRRFIPSRDGIKQNRMLRWLGPRIHDPLLWHVNRNSVARGIAIGAFFGLMVPVAQIPAAALVALAMRANLWVAAIATLVSNPFTYGPLYIFAYRLGSSILPPAVASGAVVVDDDHALTTLQWVIDALHWLTGIGRPLVLGMFLMAVCAAVVGYFGTLLLWRLKVVLKRRRQRSERGTRVTMRRASDPSR
ncbi:MAG TPA: DUF2062 domain-containing protein [Rhodocyclaceae bacterium]|nr:DUF2062 domain-containing protein [Rhodocyclaceae bacterium]